MRESRPFSFRGRRSGFRATWRFAPQGRSKRLNDKHWIASAFGLSFLAVGLPYWLIPYRGVNLPDALIGPGLLVVCGTALLLRAFRAATFWRTTGILGSSVPAAVMARVLVEGLLDPKSHNLWPLEVIIAAVLGLACALAGAAAGSLAARFKA